jgi:simple sugar transport system permease protein
MGLNVMKERYIYTVFGGIMSGLGGAHLSLSYTPGWAENITGGRGWIVIALVIFAAWNPGLAMLGALLFGGINAIQFRLQAGGTTIPAAFLNMLPYFITLAVLILMSASQRMQRHFTPPATLGKAYIPEDK